MPLTGSLGNRISEFHTGKTYAKTKARHGAATANRQAVAVAYRSIGDIHREMTRKKKK